MKYGRNFFEHYDGLKSYKIRSATSLVEKQEYIENKSMKESIGALRIGDSFYYPSKIGLRLRGAEDDVRKGVLRVSLFKVLDIYTSDSYGERIVIKKIKGKSIEQGLVFNVEFLDMVRTATEYKVSWNTRRESKGSSDSDKGVSFFEKEAKEKDAKAKNEAGDCPTCKGTGNFKDDPKKPCFACNATGKAKNKGKKKKESRKENFAKLVYTNFGIELDTQSARFLDNWLASSGYTLNDVDDIDGYGTVYTSDGLEWEEMV